MAVYQIPLFPTDTQNKKGSAVSWFQEMAHALDVIGGVAWPDRFGKAMRNWLEQHEHTPIKTLSLFSGGGGLDIGFADTGFESLFMIELEQKYVQTLQANCGANAYFLHSQPLCIDIKDFINTFDSGSIDFIIGGPPCQTFSAAGRRAAGVMGTLDPRGKLFEEYVRIVAHTRPKGFLFENVYGLTGAQNGEAWNAIFRAFTELGYNVTHRILDAADFGVPQHRERLIVVGLQDQEFFFPAPTHGPDSIGHESFYTAGEAVQNADLSGVTYGLSGQYGHLLADIPPGLNYSYFTEKLGHPHPIFGWRSKFSDFLYKADPAQPARTIKAQGGQYTGPFSWENRPFSLGEFKRLQTIPDEYQILGTRQICIQQIGNSVPPQFARMLALSILHQVFGVTLPFTMHYLPKEKQLGFRQRKRSKTQEYTAKAQASISNLDRHAVAEALPIKQADIQIRSIDSRFHWSSTSLTNGKEVQIARSFTPDEWCFEVGQPADLPLYEIQITPAQRKKWVIPTQRIVLRAFSRDHYLFTSLWKAFEEAMITRTSIADLVQLNGYYQYQPNILLSLAFFKEPSDIGWKVIQKVIDGNLVAKQLHTSQVADFLGLGYEDVFPCLKMLRSIGYEVRNYKTNPQIPLGWYIIPYAFPTLTPRSVQLFKHMGE